MADSKFSALTAITALTGVEEFPVADAGASNKITAANMRKFMPGAELDYAQITGNVTLTATTDGNSQGTAVIDGNAVTYDGSTAIWIEVYVPRFAVNPTVAGHSGYLNLYDGTTDLGRIAQNQAEATGGSQSIAVLARRKLTPSAASHTYHIRGWKDVSGDAATAICGAGGASTLMPAYMRITVA